MKKFILLTLLASGLSAHAVPGDSPQENGDQGNEGVRLTIEQAEKELGEEVKNQAQAAQGNAAEDLNQRSAFEEDEVMQIDTTQH